VCFEIDFKFVWERIPFEISKSLEKRRSTVIMDNVVLQQSGWFSRTLFPNVYTTHIVVTYLVAFVTTTGITLHPDSPPKILEYQVFFQKYVINMIRHVYIVPTVMEILFLRMTTSEKHEGEPDT